MPPISTVTHIVLSCLPKFEIVSDIPKAKPKLVSVTGNQFIVVSIEKRLAVYDMAGTGKPRYTIEPATANAKADLLKTSKDGKYIVVTDGAKLFVLETAAGGEPLYTVEHQPEKERIATIEFIGDEDYLLVVRQNRTDKKLETSEIYDIPASKLLFNIPADIGRNPRFIASRRFLYSENLGSTIVWNMAEKRQTIIRLKTYTPDSDPNSTSYTETSEVSVENTALSPDEKIILRYGHKVVSAFEIETGREIQRIFNSEKVKYDKNGKVKESGLGKAGWAAGGRVAYAFDDGGFFDNRRTVSLWTRVD